MSEKMRAVVQTGIDKFGFTENVMDKPVPKEGQVLIKVEAAVVNPMDLINLKMDQGVPQAICGHEGSGTIVGTDKRVGFSGGGSWAEYAVVGADQCIEIAPEATWEQGACSFVNPFTAIGFLDKVR